MFNEEFFGGPGSPIFILVGGEWNIAAGWLLGGNMFEMARENHGYQFYTEHRYYGETVPYTLVFSYCFHIVNLLFKFSLLSLYIHITPYSLGGRQTIDRHTLLSRLTY